MTRPTGSERWLSRLSRIVPASEREEWRDEWLGELAHGREAGRSGGRLLASAFEDAVRLRLRAWRPGPLALDLRFAARSLRRSPGYTTVAVLTLAVGMGASTAIYSVVNATLLRPLPLVDEGSVMMVTQARGEYRGPTSAPNYLDWKDRSSSFEGMSALQPWSASLTGAGAPLHVSRNRVSADFFTTLRVQAAVGRVFEPHEDRLGAERVLVLSHELWSSAFGSDPEVLVRRVHVNGESHRVVGVLPEGFQLARFPAQIYVPWIFQPDALAARGRNNVWVVGRLASGATPEQAQEEMAAVGRQLAAEYPRSNEGADIRVETARSFALGSTTDSLILLLTAVGLLLLIACANVANLTLARGATRRGELAVRAAIGAGRARLVGQIWSESLMVALAGGAAGVVIAFLAVGPIRSMLPARLAGIGEVSVDLPVMGFAVLLALVTGTLAGLLPSLQMTRGAGRGVSLAGVLRVRGDGSRLRHGLAAGQFAVAMTLLVGAGLLLRSLSSLYAVDLGFDPEDVSSFYVTLPQAEYSTPEATVAAVDAILDQLRALPGVERSAAMSHLPLTGAGLSSSVVLEGHPEDQTVNGPSAAIRVVTPGYFQLMGIDILRGRDFDAADRTGSPDVVIINDAAAREWWPGEDPMGRWVWWANDDQDEPIRRTVVGVVADTRASGPDSSTRPQVYQPHSQTTEIWRWFGQSMSFVAETPRAPLGSAEIRKALGAVDPSLPPYGITSLEEALDRTLATPRIHGTLVTTFALVALLLAAVGIYGVMAFTVRNRTREIGLRLAIGADHRAILGDTLFGGVRTAGAGVFLGTVLSLLLARWFQSSLFGVTSTDLPTYALVALGLTAVTLAACWVPASKAARTDPLAALRTDG